MYAENLSDPKYDFLIKKRKDAGTKHLIDPNAFIECSNTMDDVYENIDDYNPNRQRKRIRKYCNKSFCRYFRKILWRFIDNPQKTVFFFDNWYNITSKWSTKSSKKVASFL